MEPLGGIVSSARGTRTAPTLENHGAAVWPSRSIETLTPFVIQTEAFNAVKIRMAQRSARSGLLGVAECALGSIRISVLVMGCAPITALTCLCSSKTGSPT